MVSPLLIFVLAVLVVDYAVECLASALTVRHAAPEVPAELQERVRRAVHEAIGG